MESKMEYIDKTAQDIRLPREVYYRCLWTVRDVTRLKQLADTFSFDTCITSETSDHMDTIEHSGIQTSDDETFRLLPEGVVKQAASDVRCINSALERVPDVYRKGIMDNIVMRVPFDDMAHPNTWKRWKLVFLYELAHELNLM